MQRDARVGRGCVIGWDAPEHFYRAEARRARDEGLTNRLAQGRGDRGDVLNRGRIDCVRIARERGDRDEQDRAEKE